MIADHMELPNTWRCRKKGCTNTLHLPSVSTEAAFNCVTCDHCKSQFFQCGICLKCVKNKETVIINQHIKIDHPGFASRILKFCPCGFGLKINFTPPSNTKNGYCVRDCANPLCNTQYFQCLHCPPDVAVIRGTAKNMVAHVREVHVPKEVSKSKGADSPPISPLESPVSHRAYFDYDNDNQAMTFSDEFQQSQDITAFETSIQLQPDHVNNMQCSESRAPLVTNMFPRELPLTFDDFTQCFSGLRNQIFFYQEHSCPGIDGGCRGITYRAFNSPPGVNINREEFCMSDLERYATEEETEFIFALTTILNEMTNSMEDKMSSVLTPLVRQFCGRRVFENIPCVPTTRHDFQKYCLRNRNSVMSSLPSEVVHKINYHACIKLNDKINHLMGHGIEIEFYDDDKNQDGLNGCRAMKNLYTRLKKQKEYTAKTKVGYILLWSDGFQVHHVRTKNNNIWILTVTFQAPNNIKGSKFHSFILAMGLKDWDHTPVVEAYLEELKSIREGHWRYCGKRKKKIHTMFDLLIYAADHPERCALAFTRDRGNMGVMWKYSLRINSDLFPSCIDCKEKRFYWLKQWYSTQSVPAKYAYNCDNCQDWECSGITKPFRSGLLKGYPTTKALNSPKFPTKRNVPMKYLYPARQSFKYLQKCCKAAFFNRATKTWSVANLNAYLQSVGVKDKLIKDIQIMGDMVIKSNLDPTEFMHTKLKLPQVWEQPCPMDAFIDSPMHMLFLGVVKSVLDELKDYALSYNKRAAFIDRANPLIASVRKYHLAFCRLELFGKKDSSTLTPGWLSDNCVSFARIMPIICGILLDDVINPKDSRDDLVQQALLKRHEQCKALVVACYVMIAHLMHASKVPLLVMEHHIKVFLQCCVEYEDATLSWTELKNAKDTSEQKKTTKKAENSNSVAEEQSKTQAQVTENEQTLKRKRQFWESKSNFVSLLNLPLQIESYGPVRHYWEGDRERDIQLIKPLIKCMRKTDSYFKIKMRDLQLHHTLELLSMKRAKQVGADWFVTANKVLRGNNIHIYKSKNEVESMMKSQKPIVGYRIDDKVFVAVGNKNTATMHEMVFNEESVHSHYCLALYYAPCKISQNISVNTDNMEMIKGLKDTCLIMPTPRKDKTRNSPVAVICSSWDVRHKDGSFGLPMLPASIYTCRDQMEFS